jgi:hypothetical protein
VPMMDVRVMGMGMRERCMVLRMSVRLCPIPRITVLFLMVGVVAMPMRMEHLLWPYRDHPLVWLVLALLSGRHLKSSSRKQGRYSNTCRSSPWIPRMASAFRNRR